MHTQVNHDINHGVYGIFYRVMLVGEQTNKAWPFSRLSYQQNSTFHKYFSEIIFLILFSFVLFFTLVFTRTIIQTSYHIDRTCSIYVFVINVHSELVSAKAFVYLHSNMLFRFVGTIPIIIVLTLIDRCAYYIHMLFCICIYTSKNTAHFASTNVYPK